jgi:hypothetical protein
MGSGIEGDLCQQNVNREPLPRQTDASGIRITAVKGTSGALSRNALDVEHKSYSILASLADFEHR